MENIIPIRLSNKGRQLYTVYCGHCGNNNPSHCRKSSIAPADYYLCPSCALLFDLPPVPDGHTRVVDLFAAPGNWVGYTTRKATPEERASQQRALDILARGLHQLGQPGVSTCVAMRRNMPGSHTEQEWENLKAFYEWTCLCCGQKEPEIQLTKDHVIPVVRGGTDDIDNLQPLCMTCNLRKGTGYNDYR